MKLRDKYGKDYLLAIQILSLTMMLSVYILLYLAATWIV